MKTLEQQIKELMLSEINRKDMIDDYFSISLVQYNGYYNIND